MMESHVSTAEFVRYDGITLGVLPADNSMPGLVLTIYIAWTWNCQVRMVRTDEGNVSS